MFIEGNSDGTDPRGVVCACEQLEKSAGSRTFHPSGVRVYWRPLVQTFNHSVVAALPLTATFPCEY